MTDDMGYIDYRNVLALPEQYKPADVIRTYKKAMKQLVIEISQQNLTEEKRNHYLLQMAQLNAAYHILRDRARGEAYLLARDELIQLEQKWRELAGSAEQGDSLRRQYDQALRNFLAIYMEELVLEAGRDPDCIEASGWDAAHERHAGRVLRQYRQQRYHEIHERLPFYEVTPPVIDWAERAEFASALLAKGEGR